MKSTAMQLDRPGEPLREVERELPNPEKFDLLIEVAACGVCRTDLHVVDGDIRGTLPIVPGHEIVGRVARLGSDAADFAVGDRVGVPWLGGTDGTCFYCTHGMENLCDRPVFTGFTRDGGYATHVLADSRFCLHIPDGFSDVNAAPLLCAGLIGYRSLKLAGEGERLGFYGFGAAAHILCQVAVHEGRRVFAFTREGDTETQAFARGLGAEWAGGSEERPPEELDGAIVFAPVGALMTAALRASAKGARIISAGIYMSDIPSFPYADLWEERTLGSVANLTREDGEQFIALAPRVPVETEITAYPLDQANQALEDLRTGRFRGAAVLDVAGSG